jgi:hypothetical protein
LQRCALTLELANFGDRAVHLRANQKIARSEYADVTELQRAAAARVEAERQVANHVLSAATEKPAEPDQNEVAGLCRDLVTFLEDTVAALGDAEKERHLATTIQPSAAMDDDGMGDAEDVALPETIPEAKVLNELLQHLTRLRARTDLTYRQRVEAILLLARHTPVFRYVLRPPEDLLTATVRLRIDSSAPPKYVRQYPLPQERMAEAQRWVLGRCVRSPGPLQHMADGRRTKR